MSTLRDRLLTEVLDDIATLEGAELDGFLAEAGLEPELDRRDFEKMIESAERANAGEQG
jgi:hypothetical protein